MQGILFNISIILFIYLIRCHNSLVVLVYKKKERLAAMQEYIKHFRLKQVYKNQERLEAMQEYITHFRLKHVYKKR